MLTNNNLKHKPICDSLKKTKIHFENFKLFRRMPKYAQPSIKRIFRKKRKNIYFRKNFIFTKRWRAPVLRSFKKKSEIIQKKTINSFGEWSSFIFRKNISIHKNMKFWEKKMKKSLWELRRSKSDYFGTASLTFTRVNYLSSKVLGKTKPSIIRDFSNGIKKNQINFKYKYPINSVESQLGYDYYNLFNSFDTKVTLNSNSFNNLNNYSQDSIYKKNIVRSINYRKNKSLSINSIFIFEKKIGKDYKSYIYKKKYVKKTIKLGKNYEIPSFLKKSIKFTPKFNSISKNIQNKISIVKNNIKSSLLKKKNILV